MREVIAARFGAVLAAEFGSGYGCEWDFQLQRYAVITPSVAGKPCKQWVMWKRDPVTGLPTKPDILGVLPFRELDAQCQQEILHNMRTSEIVNPHDGAGTWARHQTRVTAHNDKIVSDSNKLDAELFAMSISEVDLRRPWLKHHSGSTVQRRIAMGGTRS